jgi:hypothetical protein
MGEPHPGRYHDFFLINRSPPPPHHVTKVSKKTNRYLIRGAGPGGITAAGESWQGIIQYRMQSRSPFYSAGFYYSVALSPCLNLRLNTITSAPLQYVKGGVHSARNQYRMCCEYGSALFCEADSGSGSDPHQSKCQTRIRINLTRIRNTCGKAQVPN